MDTSGLGFSDERPSSLRVALGIGCNSVPKESVCVRLGWGKVELSRRIACEYGWLVGADG